ncbi:MAG: DNA mismatch repair endonuclease MutL [Spirochaetota bacterium]|jgi:DNA mismatch repair protein MutL|nr:DNA mismatch repair endonuclease MutL [Spirochaetota bacterium]
MASIVHVLEPLVRARIAAGEVIEQPASVVRELADNALDAGAHSIQVELHAGGIAQIRVQDDGCGISAADLPLAIIKHATSKISSLEDLETCLSLGFRGEALFAIASVARMRIVSNDGDGGYALLVDNGTAQEVEAAPQPRGTSITVQGLFQKMPARLAFLKSAASEARAVRRVLTEKMIAFPEVRFVLLSDGDTLINSAAGDRLARIGDIYGADMARDLIPIEHEEQGIELTGYIAPPHRTSATRREQVFMVNGRPLAMPIFSKALATGYGNNLMAGRYAIAFIAITMDPVLLNVNVHPTKREVRFQNEGAVFSALVHAVRAALSDQIPAREAPLRGYPAGMREPLSVRESRAARPDLREPDQDTPCLPHSGGYLRSTYPAGFSAARDTQADGMRVLGCYASNYWIYEQEGVLCMADQHAAHERVLYERFKKEYTAGGITRQALLVPISFTPDDGEREVMEEQAAVLQEAGFSVAPFGKRNWIIDEYPAGVKDVLAALRSLLAALAANPHANLADARDANVFATLACHAAVRQGDIITEAAFREILAGLTALDKPHTCPHGRPAIVRLEKEEIEKWFSRR